MLVMKPSYTPFVLYVELSGAFWAQLVDRSSSSRPHLRPKVMARINGPGSCWRFSLAKAAENDFAGSKESERLALWMIGLTFFIKVLRYIFSWLIGPHVASAQKEVYGIPYFINNKRLCWGWFMALALPHEQIWTAHSLQGRQVAVAQGDLCTCWQIVSLGNFARHKCQDLWQVNRIILISYDNYLIIMVDAVVSKKWMNNNNNNHHHHWYDNSLSRVATT